MSKVEKSIQEAMDEIGQPTVSGENGSQNVQRSPVSIYT